MSEHGEDWSDWMPSDDGPTCKCGFNGSPTECQKFRELDAAKPSEESL